MKVFLSYSTADLSLVNEIANHIKKYGDVFYWDNSKVPGQESWPTIFQWIDSADLVLVVITGNTVTRAMSVGQEIGRAKAKSKIIIPLVAPEVPASELGFLNGVTYQKIDPSNPGPALQQINRVLHSHKQKIESDQSFIAFLGVVGLIWLGVALAKGK